MNRLKLADEGQEQLDGLALHAVTITRGEVDNRSVYIARCSGCTWAMFGTQTETRSDAAEHSRIIA